MGEHYQKPGMIYKTGTICNGTTSYCTVCGKQREAAHIDRDDPCLCTDEHNNRLLMEHKDTRRPCKKDAINGTEKCEFHGGIQLRGEAHPNFKTGKYAEALPKRYRQAYARAMADKGLTKLKEQIALCDVREDELVGTLTEGGMPLAMSNFKKKLKKLAEIARTPDVGADQIAMASLKVFEASEGVITIDNVWVKLHKNMEQRRLLVETERRRLESLAAYISMDQVDLLAVKMVQLFRQASKSIVAMVANEVPEEAKLIVMAESTRIERNATNNFAARLRRMISPSETELHDAMLLEGTKDVEAEVVK